MICNEVKQTTFASSRIGILQKCPFDFKFEDAIL